MNKLTTSKVKSKGIVSKSAGVSALSKQSKKQLVKVEPPGLLYKTISEEEAKKIWGGGDVKTMLDKFSITKPYKHGEYNPVLTMSFSGMITGCGLGQIYGIASLRDTDECKKSFNEIMEEYAERVKEGKYAKVGGLLGTLGESYKSVWDYIEKFGFKQIAEYTNHNHGPSYKQRLYIYELDTYAKLVK